LISGLTLLWHDRRFLGRCLAVGVVISTIIAFVIPARYTSTARLMPPEQGSGAGMASIIASVAGKAGGEMGSLSSLGSDLLGLKTSSDLFLGVLKSRTVADDLITKFDLRKVYWDRRWEDARKDLEKRTDLSADRKSGIITIMVEDRSPQRASEMAAEYVAQLDRVVTKLGNSSARKERVFLEQRLAQVNQDLETSEKDFSSFASKNTAIDIKEQGKAMLEAVGKTEGELIAAETELQGLRQLYTENNVRVRASEARIEELRRQVKKLGGSTNPSEGSSSTNQIDDYPSIRQLPGLGVPYADLYRRIKVQEAIFETLTRQYEMAKIEEAKETLSVKLLDVPEIPEKHSFPPRMLMILCGAFLALAAGVLWLWGAHRWERADPGDAGKVLAQDVFDSVRRSARKLRGRSSNS
jgi:capsule polysaccharide export protein KpsE/RkpR